MKPDKDSTYHYAKAGRIVEFVCPQCEVAFALRSKQLRNSVVNKAKGKTGPFCSRRCAGRYGTDVQYNKGRVAELV